MIDIDMRWVFVFNVAAFGLAFIVGRAEITDPFRGLLVFLSERHTFIGWITRWGARLLECVVCTGFWIGFVFGAYHWRPDAARWGLAIATGCYVSGANFILGRMTRLIEDPPEEHS